MWWVTSVPAGPAGPSSPMTARKMSSRVGCFSTYSIVAGGRSRLSSARVPLAMIRPSWRMAIRSASCSASSRYWVVSRTVVPCPASSWIGLPHLVAGLRVEAGRRFVQEDHRRVPDQAHRDVETSPHAPGVRRDPPLRSVGQREALQQDLSDRARVLEMPELGDEHEVLPPAEDLVDGRELPGEADGVPHVRRFRGDVEAGDAGRSGVGLEQRGEDLHQGGLAGAVGAEQGEDAAPRHVEVHAAQHFQVLVRLLQTLYLNGVRCCHATRVEP